MDIRIVPFRGHHITERYVAWLNDSDVVRFSEQRHRAHSMGSVLAFIERYTRDPHNRMWAIEVDGQHVGNITASVDPKNGTAEVSNLIGEKAFWGRGVGTTSVRQAINALLNEGYRKVWMGALASNGAELRIMEKLGMELDCVIRAHFVVDGEPVDEIRRAIFAPGRPK